MIIFELRNNFYNFKTLLFYLENFSKFNQSNSGSGFFSNPHYFLSLSLIIIVAGVSFIKNLNAKLIYSLAAVLLIGDLFIFLPKPTQGFGMAKSWKFRDEQKAFEIIQSQNISGYNITNLGYDTLAHVQKYLHKRNNIEANLSDYWQTKRMYVIAPNTKDILNDQTYEIQVVKPFVIVYKWEINSDYTLYLLEKT